MKKVAWIIGASSGIGRALALQLANERYKLAISARSEKALSSVLKVLQGDQHSSYPCDVSKLDTIKRAYNKIIKRYGHVDLLIFAAGVYTPMPLHQYDHKESLKILDINLTGALNTFEVIKSLATAKDQPFHLAWISSVAGYRGLPNSCTYGVGKSGLISFAEIQRVELIARESNQRAIQFYESLGFRIEGRLENRIKNPDAFLERHGSVYRIVQAGGSYNHQQLQSFHDYAQERAIPYEVW